MLHVRHSAIAFLFAAFLLYGCGSETAQQQAPPAQQTPEAALADTTRPEAYKKHPTGDSTARPTENPPTTDPSNTKAAPAEYAFPYDMKRPKRRVKLPNNLDEVSGLTWIRQDVLGLVHDEKGNIYYYDMSREEIIEKIDFGKGGDYEGVEKVGDVLWVVRSDGRLYRYAGKDKVDKFKNFLDSDYDVEGLGYQPGRNRLLLACKGYPGKGKALRNFKAVYGFDLRKKELSEKPVYTVDLAVAEAFKGATTLDDAYKAAGEFFNPGKGSRAFQPSAIAEHPLTKNIYIIASVGKLLVVLSPGGKLLHMAHINEDMLRQPEGLCFGKNGEMFIASEGAGNKARILEFSMQP